MEEIRKEMKYDNWSSGLKPELRLPDYEAGVIATSSGLFKIDTNFRALSKSYNFS
jgi:hypothetical protein